MAIDVSCPEAAYLSRDNIVPPDAHTARLVEEYRASLLAKQIDAVAPEPVPEDIA